MGIADKFKITKYKEFVEKFNIFNYDAENQENLNKAHNRLKKELNVSRSLMDMFTHRYTFKWEPDIYYEEGEIVSYYTTESTNENDIINSYYIAIHDSSIDNVSFKPVEFPEYWRKITPLEIFSSIDFSNFVRKNGDVDWTIVNNYTSINYGHLKNYFNNTNRGNITFQYNLSGTINLNDVIVAGNYMSSNVQTVTNNPFNSKDFVLKVEFINYQGQTNSYKTSYNETNIFEKFLSKVLTSITKKDTDKQIHIPSKILQTITYSNFKQFKRYGTYSNNTLNWGNWTETYLKEYIDIEIQKVRDETVDLNEKLQDYVYVDSSRKLYAKKNSALAIKTTDQGFTPGKNNVSTIGNSSNVFKAMYATDFIGTALKAKYADLAEIYNLGFETKAGDVIGINEYGFKLFEQGDKLIGVVSDKPGFIINSDEQGTPIALKGLTPVEIEGTAKIGQYIIAYKNGKGIAVDAIKTEDILYKLGIVIKIEDNKIFIKV